MKALTSCGLFKGIPPERIPALKTALGMTEQSCGAGEVIIHQGDRTDALGVVLSGEIDAVSYRSDGSRTVIAVLGEGEVFADFLAAGEGARSPATVAARCDCRVLRLPLAALFSPLRGFECEQRALLFNLVGIYAGKYFELKDRLLCISAPTLRGKLLNYLNMMSRRAGSTAFEIPFDRDGLAAYLSADRSALSRELSRMKKDGLVEYCKNSFKLLS